MYGIIFLYMNACVYVHSYVYYGLFLIIYSLLFTTHSKVLFGRYLKKLIVII